MRRLALACALAIMSQAASAAPSSEEIAKAQEAQALGAEMFAYDQAAWHATDRFLKEDVPKAGLDMPALVAQGVKAYIVEPEQNGRLLTTYYADRNGLRSAFARYVVEGSRVVSGGIVQPDGDRNLSLLAMRMIDAREKAMAAMAKPDHGLCSRNPPNSLVLPPRSTGSMPVYIMTSSTVAGIYPAGGHYRFDFDADGKLVGERRFMKSCFDVNYAPKEGVKPEIVGLSHLLDPAPTEIHAFVSRNIPVPLMVITVSNRAVWGISDGKVEYVQDVPNEQ